MRKLFIIFLLSLLIVACNISVDTASDQKKTIDPGDVATAVALTLTSRPIAMATTPIKDYTSPFSTSTPIPTRTLTVTPTITMTASPTYTSTPINNFKSTLGEPDKKITFNNGKEGFFDDDDEYTIINIENGTLVMTSTMKITGWHGWSMQYQKIGNFYLEATIKTHQCSGRDEYGLVFRAPDYSKGYFFGFNCDDKYSLRALTNDFNNITEWKTSPYTINKYPDNNRLGVLAVNDHYSMYINDQLLEEVTDSTFTAMGTFGIFIAAFQTPGFTIEVDEIDYWNI